MTQSETVAYLAKAQQALKEARIVADNDLAEAAGRAADLAAYHAAQAFIFERGGKAAKSHNGVRSEFARLARDEPRIDRRFVTFLARAYNLKATADYAIGADGCVSLSEAEQAIESAVEFVDGVSRLLASEN
ncbi:MAG: HEPN domain-containing protein [Alphaproteobacteria bacterium]|nr:HEPN domain-containing protein [Alphaproteobacteria bacterium]MBM3651386.1 HEPN domain-containing protein [Alphaproteobacteria bacterium]